MLTNAVGGSSQASLRKGSVRMTPSVRPSSLRARSGAQNAAPTWLRSRVWARFAAEGLVFLAAAVGVAYSAMMAKERGLAPALAVSVQDVVRLTPGEAESLPLLATTAIDSAAPEVEIEFTPIEKPSDPVADEAFPADTRWFNGRPVRPTGVLRMRVTAYSPDAHSCGDSADGLTATLHSVETNAFQLVAADPRVLKYGSLITVPGYADDAIVPVLDCGGKIKGSRLDVLYPTHGEAKRWGSRWLTVTLWTYADGKPAGNPRKLR
jgi:3D (Asp-Asp-Asp) domain-containing protein